jgi:hypothetical protein
MVEHEPLISMLLEDLLRLSASTGLIKPGGS